MLNNKTIEHFKEFLTNSTDISIKLISYYLKWVLDFFQSNVSSDESKSKKEKVNVFLDELMVESAVFSYSADRVWRKLWKLHMLYRGYFRMKHGP